MYALVVYECVCTCAFMPCGCMCVFHSLINIGIFSADKTVGLFWLNAAETWIDISSATAGQVSQKVTCSVSLASQ